MSTVTFAISATELFFTGAKSVLLGASPAYLRACGVLSFLIESVAGMALTILLLNNAWNVDAGLPGIQAAVLIVIITEVLSVLTEGHSIYNKMSGKDEDGGRSGSGGGRRRTIVKWFSCTSGLAILSYSLLEEHMRHFDSLQRLIFVDIVTVVVIIQMLVIGLGSLLWRGKFIFRIAIALLILVVDLCVGAAVLASGRLENETAGETQNSSYFLSQVAMAVFVLTIASAVTSVSAFRLVGYKARGEVANDQVQFIETVVLSSVGPFIVMAMTETVREEAVRVLLTILPQMSVHLGPLLFEYLMAMRCGFEDGGRPLPFEE